MRLIPAGTNGDSVSQLFLQVLAKAVAAGSEDRVQRSSHGLILGRDKK